MIDEIAFIIYLFFTFVYIALFVMTLVKQAKAKEWVWFVLSLLINPVWIIYWIVRFFKK